MRISIVIKEIYPNFRTIRIDIFYRIPRTIVVLSYAEIFLQQRVLLQEMDTVGVIEPRTEVGIIDLLESQMLFFLTGECIPII